MTRRRSGISRISALVPLGANRFRPRFIAPPLLKSGVVFTYRAVGYGWENYAQSTSCIAVSGYSQTPTANS
jgi:hypothetical protein